MDPVEDASTTTTTTAVAPTSSSAMYMLRWHCQEATVCASFARLLDAQLLTDCAIAVRSGRRFRAHKVVLAACSGYFLDVFQSLGSNESPIVVLHETKPEDIEAILAYIYKGNCLVRKEQIPRLISLAKVLKIQGLCNIKSDDLFGGDKPSEDDCDNNNQNRETHLNNNNNELLNNKKILRDLPEVCKCFVCGKYLSNQYNLRVHMETHKDTYYSCVSCPHVSKSRDALRKHVSYRHPEEYSTRKKKKIC